MNSAALLIVVLSIALLYFYSARLKRTVLIGNLVIGLMTGMAFIYGGVVVGRMERAVVPAIFAFLVNLARELLKDVEDMEGDRKRTCSYVAHKIRRHTNACAGNCFASRADWCHDCGGNIRFVSFCVFIHCACCRLSDVRFNSIDVARSFFDSHKTCEHNFKNEYDCWVAFNYRWFDVNHETFLRQS